MKVPVIGISRHRIGIDGKGVTTLVAFHDCPMRCKYCLNPQALGKPDHLPAYTPMELYRKVKIDDLYFRTTGGGICFGGGEPLERSRFIAEFKELCPPEWKLSVETSLHAGYADLKRLAPLVDEWIVDIKADDPRVYERYTGQKAWRVALNLKLLTEEFGVEPERFTIRVPVIPGFVSEEAARRTAEKYREKFPNVEVFTYRTEQPDAAELRRSTCRDGKMRCEYFKAVRRELAARNGIEMEERECLHEGDCPGTCPRCDFETEILWQKLEARGVSDFSVSAEREAELAALQRAGANALANDKEDGTIVSNGLPIQGDLDILEGDVEPPLPPGLRAWPRVRKKVLFKECAVAGVSFHLNYDDDIWLELEEGTPVALVRERNNKYDKNAVAIALACDYDGDPDNFDFDLILGYVPKSENAQIAQMLDMGWDDVFVAELSTVKKYGHVNHRLRISIYVQRKEPEIVRPNLLRAHSLCTLELRKMVDELNERGTAYFRFGGFPHYPLQFPEVGEKIVMVHRDEGSEVLFLMRVLAVGEDCAPYLEDPESIYATDDCEAFVLTNVMGPIRVRKANHRFMRGLNLKGLSATDYLSKPASRGFTALFERVLAPTLNRNNIDSDPSIDWDNVDVPLPGEPPRPQ